MCPKDPYLLSNIDKLIDRSFGYKTLSFMDVYSGYNQIKMNPLDAPKNESTSNNYNYYYEVISFGLKNENSTYQRLLDAFFWSNR